MPCNNLKFQSNKLALTLANTECRKQGEDKQELINSYVVWNKNKFYNKEFCIVYAHKMMGNFNSVILTHYIFLFNFHFYLLSDKYNLPALVAMNVKCNYSFNDITLILYTALIFLDVMLCYTKTYPSTSASEGHCDVMRVLRWFLPTINLHLFPFRPLTQLRLLP